jgi:hypothetical protein
MSAKEEKGGERQLLATGRGEKMMDLSCGCGRHAEKLKVKWVNMDK